MCTFVIRQQQMHGEVITQMNKLGIKHMYSECKWWNRYLQKTDINTMKMPLNF